MDIKIISLVLLTIVLAVCAHKTKKRKKVSNLFFLFSTLLFALLFTELIYRNFFQKRRVYGTPVTYFQPDSLNGYRLNPGHMQSAHYYGEKDTIFSQWYTILPDTDARGQSYPFRTGYKNDTTSKETVFLGCSITFGEGLADEETLPYQYGQLTGTSVVNRGCNGYGIHQIYQLFQSEYAHHDNRNRVFVYSFSSDHILRASGVYVWNCGGPLFVMSGDTLLNKGISYKVKPLKGARLAHYGSFMGAFTFIRDIVQREAFKRSVRELTENDLAPSYYMLRQMAQRIQETGGKLIILNWDYSLMKIGSKLLEQDISDKKIEKEISHTGAIVLPVAAVIDYKKPEYSIKGDGHPTALTNKVLAQYLLERPLSP